MGLLIRKGFCGYFLMWADACQAAKGDGILVGPGRGSGGGSLVGYLSGITDLDPIDAGLMFERFLTEGRNELPDFDVDFPASAREWINRYITTRWGEEYVVRVGTHVRMKNKKIIRALASILRDIIPIHYPDIGAICAVIDEAKLEKPGSGRLGSALGSAQRRVRTCGRSTLLFRYAERMGRLHYGQHAGGFVISPDEPLRRLPLRSVEAGWSPNTTWARSPPRSRQVRLPHVADPRHDPDVHHLIERHGRDISVYD
jgi:DNA polymerase-3 subunit alpha